MVLESILDPVFNWLLPWPPWMAILFISLILTLITTLIYKYTTNQTEMKRLKDETKMHQKKLKELKDNPKKAMEVQKQAMAVNMEYMKHSFKPMLYTMLPLVIIFGWLSSYYAYEPLKPGVPFNVSIYTDKLEGKEVTLEVYPELQVLSPAKQTIQQEQALWTLQGGAGDYKLIFKQGDTTAEKKIIINDGRKYANPLEVYRNSPIQKVVLHNEALHPFGNLSIFGWHPGWIAAYIIFSIALSSLFRKLMKVY